MLLWWIKPRDWSLKFFWDTDILNSVILWIAIVFYSRNRMIWEHTSRKWRLHILLWWEYFNSNKDIMDPNLVEKQRKKSKENWMGKKSLSSPHTNPAGWKMGGQSWADQFLFLPWDFSELRFLHTSFWATAALPHSLAWNRTSTAHLKRTGWKPAKAHTLPSQHPLGSNKLIAQILKMLTF